MQKDGEDKSDDGKPHLLEVRLRIKGQRKRYTYRTRAQDMHECRPNEAEVIRRHYLWECGTSKRAQNEECVLGGREAECKRYHVYHRIERFIVLFVP